MFRTAGGSSNQLNVGVADAPQGLKDLAVVVDVDEAVEVRQAPRSLIAAQVLRDAEYLLDSPAGHPHRSDEPPRVQKVVAAPGERHLIGEVGQRIAIPFGAEQHAVLHMIQHAIERPQEQRVRGIDVEDEVVPMFDGLEALSEIHELRQVAVLKPREAAKGGELDAVPLA